MFAFYEKMNSCRQQRRPGIRADFAVRLQSRFGLEAPDGFFGCGAWLDERREGGTEAATNPQNCRILHFCQFHCLHVQMVQPQ